MSNNETVANRLNREKKDKTIYNNIINGDGPLSKNENGLALRDIFALAMGFGYRNNKSRKTIKSKDQFINSTNFGEDLPVLIRSLAVVVDNSVEILSKDTSELYVAAEEYANAGISILNDYYDGNEDEMIEILRIELLKFNDNNKIINKLNEMDI